MIKTIIAAMMLLAAPVGAIAAPFCLSLPNGSPLCTYTDGDDCAREANKQNGSCIPNPAEVTLPTARVGDYCLVMPNGTTTCGYADGNVCARDALRQKGACARSAGAPDRPLPNAYVPNAGR